MAACDTYFPRGPVKTAESKPYKTTVKRKSKEKPLELFKRKPVVKKKREPKKQRHEKKEHEKSTVRLNDVSLLQYATLQEGFLVVGCIKEIFSTQMTVTLPGRLVAQVKIHKISDPFSSLLSSYAEGEVLPEDVPTLKDLFRVGELVTGCVKQVFRTERSSHKVLLSLNPSDVNSDKTERILEENVVLVGAVKSKEDHGYVVDLGIPGVTAFLPFNRTSAYLEKRNSENLLIGQVIRVAVKKVIRAVAGVTTVELTIEPHVLAKAVPRSGFTVDNLTPGQQMNVFIKQVMPNGIEVSPVHAFEDYSSYVHIAYVPDVWGNISGILPGKVFSATLLYSLTPVNILYFSLKSYSNESNCLPCFEDGTIIDDAKVIAMAGTSVYLQLGSRNLNAKGFVSLKQSGGITNFSIGQSYKTRILHYDFIEKVYICSLNKDVISAEIFSTKELQLGQTVKCTVTGFKENKGLSLKLGTLNAFAPLCHLTDHPHRTLTSSLASLYKNNSIVTAKVFNITEGNEVILTLKPTLLSSEALCKHEDAVVRKYYYGTINRIIDSGIVVRFFGDLCGFVPNKRIASFVTGLSKESFHEGQVIRCYVFYVNPVERKLILSLIPDAASDLKLGSSYNVEIIQCNESGIDVTIADAFNSGFVPLYQVTDHLNLLSSIMKNYTSGTVIENAVLYSFADDLTPLFTLRKSVKNFIQENPLIYSDKISDLVNNLVVPCSVTSVEDSGIHLNVTLPGFKDAYFVSQKTLSESQLSVNNFKKNQALMAVIKLKDDSVELSISDFSVINEFGVGVGILEDYLSQAVQFQAISPGDKTRVKVIGVTDDIVNVKLLDKKLIGSFQKILGSKNFKENDRFEAHVLWQDPKTQHVYIHPDLELSNRTTDYEDLKTFSGSVEEAQVLLLLEDLVVGVLLSGNCCGQLTFIPRKSHFNDLTLKKPSLLSSVRVVPCKLVNGLIVSEREKRIKTFSKQSGKTENDIICNLLGCNLNERKISMKENQKKNKRKSSESSENDEIKNVATSKNRRISSGNDNDSINKFCVAKSNCVDDEDYFFNGKLLKKSKKAKKYVDMSESNDTIYRENCNNLNSSDEWNNVNGAHEDNLLEHSFDDKKKKKRKNSSSENGIKTTEKSAHIYKNSFEISPIGSKEDKSKKKSKLTNTPTSSNGFNVSSHQEEENEQLLGKKRKKRKTSASFGEEISDVAADPQNGSFSDLKKNNNSGISGYGDDTLNSMKRNSNVTDEPEQSKKKKLNGLLNDSENHDVIRQKTNRKKKLKGGAEVNKKSEDTDDEEHKSLVDNDTYSKANEKPRLSLSAFGGFCWNINTKDFSVGTNEHKDNDDEGDEEEDDDEGDKLKRPKTPAEKKAAAKEAEKHLRQAELNLLEAETNPQSADHFERLVLAQPNNSLIWVKYMAYHLQAAEIDKARAVANRALKSIIHREEQERLNVWVALLNLENLYGTQESLKKTLEEAVRSNDEYQIYSKMVEIYADSNKNMELDQLTTLMVKKFKTDLECWLLCCRCLLKSGMAEKARSIFQRGLQTLLKKEHVQYITRFALMENSFGSTEHAQTLMEHVLTTYPGRIPSWMTYVDMLTKSGQIDLARSVLERAVGQKLPVKKMKTLYKKWLHFEEAHGSETSVNHVRQAAENYVNSLNASIISV